MQVTIERSQYVTARDRHEALKPENETFTSQDRDETFVGYETYRDVKIGLHVITIADVNLFSRPLIIIIIIIIHNLFSLTLP